MRIKTVFCVFIVFSFRWINLNILNGTFSNPGQRSGAFIILKTFHFRLTPLWHSIGLGSLLRYISCFYTLCDIIFILYSVWLDFIQYIIWNISVWLNLIQCKTVENDWIFQVWCEEEREATPDQSVIYHEYSIANCFRHSSIEHRGPFRRSGGRLGI